jgi:glycosyltransferase involved in cell wall biosynthesis
MTSKLPVGLSIIVPAYNEERTICQVLCELINLECTFPVEIIVLSDGSTDSTSQIVMDPKHIFKVRFVDNKVNRGKGNVVRQGIQMASYSHTLIFDADLEYFALDIPNMFSFIQSGIAQVVFGSRVRGVNTAQPSLGFAIGRAVMTHYINILFDSTITDLHTCLKLIPTEVLLSSTFTENGFGLDTEIACELLRRKLHPFEVPITYVGRTATEGKKIGPKDGLICLKIVTAKRLSRKFKEEKKLLPLLV